MRKIATVLLLALSHPGMYALYEPQEPIGSASQESVEEGKTFRWKAYVFASAALIAVVAGIAAIAIDGGTSAHVGPPQPPQKPPLVPCAPNLICPIPEGTPVVPPGTLVPIGPIY